MSKRPTRWGRPGDDRSRSLSPEFIVTETMKAMSRQLTKLDGWTPSLRRKYEAGMRAVPETGTSISAGTDSLTPIRRESLPPQGPDDYDYR